MPKKHMKEIRSKTDEELHMEVNQLDSEIAKFRAAQQSGEGTIKVLTGERGGISWGTYQKAKKRKARILSVLNERINRRNGMRKPIGRRNEERKL